MMQKNRGKKYFGYEKTLETLDVPWKTAICRFLIDDNSSSLKGGYYESKNRNKVRKRNNIREKRSWAFLSNEGREIYNGSSSSLLPCSVPPDSKDERSTVGAVMGWLRVYDWEKEMWPEFRDVKIERKEQHKLLKKLSKHFKICEPILRWSYKHGVAAGNGGGSYHYRSFGASFIRIGKVTVLGTLCHEFAHHLAAMRYGSCQGHNKKFKRELKRTYTWAKRWLPESVSISNQKEMRP